MLVENGVAARKITGEVMVNVAIVNIVTITVALHDIGATRPAGLNIMTAVAKKHLVREAVQILRSKSRRQEFKAPTMEAYLHTNV